MKGSDPHRGPDLTFQTLVLIDSCSPPEMLYALNGLNDLFAIFTCHLIFKRERSRFSNVILSILGSRAIQMAIECFAMYKYVLWWFC